MRRFLICLAMVLASATAHAADRTIRLHPSEGTPIIVATLKSTENGRYEIEWDDSKFGDFFLSMRPFKCLESTEKLWCRIDYPYEIRRSIAGGDLTDLEYDLLFVWKNANEYGINLWNGIYYRLSPDGDGFDGRLYEFDVNVLASPPEDGSLRPITEDHLEEGDPNSHWLPKITIR